MTIILRHTSAAVPVRLDIEHTPACGDRLEHPELGTCVVSHVYGGPVPVVVAVEPREGVHGFRVERRELVPEEVAW